MKKNQKISFFDYTDLFKKNEKELINIFKNVSKEVSNSNATSGIKQ